MALKPCLDCSRLSDQSRCPEHRAARERGRQQRPTNTTRDWAERQRRAFAVTAHRQVNGDWCPGYGVQAHPSTDLTADHIVSIHAGGEPNGPLQVLCRSCNGRKAGRGSGGTPNT